MNLRPLGTGLALSTLAGYLGTKAMEPVSMKLYQLESEQARAREDAARPGPPYRIAAEKLSKVFGFELSEKQLNRLSLAFHYGLAIQWSPVYPLLRRYTSLNPVAAGLATGTAMSVVADELMTPAFGFSAPTSTTPSSPTPAASPLTSPSASPSPPSSKPAGQSLATGHRPHSQPPRTVPPARHWRPCTEAERDHRTGIRRERQVTGGAASLVGEVQNVLARAEPRRNAGRQGRPVRGLNPWPARG